MYNVTEALSRIHIEVCCPYCRGPEVKVLDSTPSRDKYECDECMSVWLQSYQVVQHTVPFHNN
jgi:hypothetical protein